MLRSSQRLSARQFSLVMERGRAYHSPFFVVRTAFSFPDTRISAVAPKKVARTAVERNRTRRSIYSMIAPIFVRIVPGTHAIVFAKKLIAGPENNVAAKDLGSLFVKAGLLK